MMEGTKLDLKLERTPMQPPRTITSRSGERFLRDIAKQDIQNWDNFISIRTKRPAPRPSRVENRRARGYKRVRPYTYKVEVPADTWRYPKGLESLELNIVHYAAAFNFTKTVKYLIMRDSTTELASTRLLGF